jgi:TonB family protein
MRMLLICGSAAFMLALSACDGGEQDSAAQNAFGSLPPGGLPAAPGQTGNALASAAGAIPPNAMFLVGRWGRHPGCERVVEFRADGSMTNHRGETGSWSADGSPPMVTLNIPAGSIRGSLQQTPQGVEIRGAGAGQVLSFYRCDSAPGGAGGMTGGNMAVPAPPPPPAAPAGGAHRLLSGSISDADYPASAIRAGAQGTTRVRLQVGPDGRVTGCSVVGTSGNAALDSTTCSVMQRRFRFSPVAGTVEQTMVWRLPNN